MNGKKARYHFEHGYMCAESVLVAICESEQIDSPCVPAIATAFCSGISRSKGLCGALTGGIMGISLIHGRTKQGDNHDICYNLTKSLTENFQSKNKTDNCFELTNCDFSTPEGSEKFKKDGLKQKICLNLVEEVTDYTLELLRKQKEK